MEISKSITFGNILTLAFFVIAVSVGYVRLQDDVAFIHRDMDRIVLDVKDNRTDIRSNNDRIHNVEVDFASLQAQLRAIDEKLDKLLQK